MHIDIAHKLVASAYVFIYFSFICVYLFHTAVCQFAIKLLLTYLLRFGLGVGFRVEFGLGLGLGIWVGLGLGLSWVGFRVGLGLG